MGINFDIKNFDKIFERIPFKSILWVTEIVLAVLVLCPDSVLEKLSVLSFKNYLEKYIGPMFLIISVVLIVTEVKKYIDKNKKKRAFTGRRAKKRFEKLSSTALKIVLKMYRSPSHSIELELGDANAVILENYLFVGRGTVSSIGMCFDYFLQPWVVEYLDKHISEYEKVR